MKAPFNPLDNFEKSKKTVGYIPRRKAKSRDYEALGFKCGLEVHQQLNTREKLFCRCPVGLYQKFDDFDAELIRHMRPTLSEMGTYDGTALMEFKTKKNITYRIKNRTTCTYEIDDTPPFPINREALEYAIGISLLLKQSIVGELHITRKQYLDGSIPTGFQRTAIVGIEGEIPLRHKTVRIIQLSVEEDSCREVSDIGHERTYTTDRLGIPLIETVTHPDMTTPEEAREAAHYIRFLNRSTGTVRTGIGAAREDVNVSVRGGSRVEIKGVSHIYWIPELTHNEAFRQKALLGIKKELLSRIPNPTAWKPAFKTLNFDISDIEYPPIKSAMDRGWKLVAGNLPNFQGILSFFIQPGQTFADELIGRLKVIACLEKPNMVHSEDLKPVFNEDMLEKRSRLLGSGPKDAQVVIWGPEEDITTAIETIEERCRMAFAGVPNETRKALKNRTTIFERVLPGADRMYPDTDSAPIPIEDDYIETIRAGLPQALNVTLKQLEDWKIPPDTRPYILRNNLIPILGKLIKSLGLEPKFAATTFGHLLKHIQGQYEPATPFLYEQMIDIFQFIKDNGLEQEIIKKMLPVIYQNPQMDFNSVLNSIEFKRLSESQILQYIHELADVFTKIRTSKDPAAQAHWIMGNLRSLALGNLPLNQLKQKVETALSAKDKRGDRRDD